MMYFTLYDNNTRLCAFYDVDAFLHSMIHTASPEFESVCVTKADCELNLQDAGSVLCIISGFFSFGIA